MRIYMRAGSRAFEGAIGCSVNVHIILGTSKDILGPCSTPVIGPPLSLGPVCHALCQAPLTKPYYQAAGPLLCPRDWASNHTLVFKKTYYS